MSACRVEDIFADSKFLRAESLHELVKAIMWASGPIKRVASSGEESDTAQVGLLSQLWACLQTAATSLWYTVLLLWCFVRAARVVCVLSGWTRIPSC